MSEKYNQLILELLLEKENLWGEGGGELVGQSCIFRRGVAGLCFLEGVGGGV